MLRRHMLVLGAVARGGRYCGTHCWEESKCKYTEQAGLAASTVADDDEFPVQPGTSAMLNRCEVLGADYN